MSGEVITSEVDSSTWELMKSQATALVASGFLPKAVNTPEKALAIALKGRELGLPMMTSIASIHIIDGKPTMAAELIAGLVHSRLPGAVLRCVETSDKVATYEAGRPGDKILRMSFTIAEAQSAGLLGKDNWKKYPAAMLRARCCSAICRVVFPDATMGIYTPDELGAITTESGTPEIIDVTPLREPQPRSAAPEGTAPETMGGEPVISEAQSKRFYAIAKSGGNSDEEIHAWLRAKHGISSTKAIPKSIYEDVCKAASGKLEL